MMFHVTVDFVSFFRTVVIIRCHPLRQGTQCSIFRPRWVVWVTGCGWDVLLLAECKVSTFEMVQDCSHPPYVRRMWCGFMWYFEFLMTSVISNYNLDILTYPTFCPWKCLRSVDPPQFKLVLWITLRLKVYVWFKSQQKSEDLKRHDVQWLHKHMRHMFRSYVVYMHNPPWFICFWIASWFAEAYWHAESSLVFCGPCTFWRRQWGHRALPGGDVPNPWCPTASYTTALQWSNQKKPLQLHYI